MSNFGPIIAIDDLSHDGHSRLDYGVDWRPFLASGEEIVTSAWSVVERPDNALVLSSGVVVGTEQTLIWAQPGTAFASLALGKRYRINNRITTNFFRREDTSMWLVVEEH